MQRCWFANDECRPTFAILKEKMSDLLALESDSLYIRNVTQELPTSYYLHDSHTQHYKQYVGENTYITINGDTNSPPGSHSLPGSEDEKIQTRKNEDERENVPEKRMSSTAF